MGMTAPSDLFGIEWSADALERISQLRDARGMLDIWIEDAVRECRENGRGDQRWEQVGDETRENHPPKPITWERIAAALGVSKQYAWQRYRDI